MDAFTFISFSKKPEPSQLINSYLTLFILCQTCFNASQVQIKHRSSFPFTDLLLDEIISFFFFEMLAALLPHKPFKKIHYPKVQQPLTTPEPIGNLTIPITGAVPVHVGAVHNYT